MREIINDWVIDLYNQNKDNPEKIYWWEAIISCHWKKIDDVLKARRYSKLTNPYD